MSLSKSLHTSNEREEKASGSENINAYVDGDKLDDHLAELESEFQPPDGGLEAWGVVLGSWCGQLVAYGPYNGFGAFQSYYGNHQLAGFSADAISWIGSIQLFLTFSATCICGRFYDAYGPRWLLLSGSAIYVLASFLLGVCKEFYQFFLVQGVLLGIGSALICVPCVAAVSQYFSRKKGLALGIVITAGGIGGILFTQMLSHLFDRIGFAWSTRVLAFVTLALLVITNLTVKSILPPRKPSPILETFSGFKEGNFLLLTLGIWFFLLGLTPAYFFLPGFASSIGAAPTFALYCTTFVNVGSIVGRLGAGFIADRIGRFNSTIIFTFLSGLFPLTMWLPCRTTPTLIAFGVLWGFVSGGCETLFPSCVGQICAPQLTGNRMGAMYSIGSIASLISGPISGALIAHSNAAVPSGYVGATVLCGVAMLASSLCVVGSRFITERRIFIFV
ncbi:hypothetical protein BOTBODRAFT_551810 [Botryobasidium botryosum FD-172 SS1]|uniref:Major facilitator superfamily (MFS) profile domain-containing protein n=1 Tax=Botryobasidium botryosum (strain FD-172 SS1) TaxID=930990 RepID=A0A067MQY6_BOTB1|nr:hypothetical protein BOTBODRAFT_551810 [Botryobasidium botryosum FD-172 SS1]